MVYKGLLLLFTIFVYVLHFIFLVLQAVIWRGILDFPLRAVSSWVEFTAHGYRRTMASTAFHVTRDEL